MKRTQKTFPVFNWKIGKILYLSSQKTLAKLRENFGGMFNFPKIPIGCHVKSLKNIVLFCDECKKLMISQYSRQLRGKSMTNFAIICGDCDFPLA